MVEVLDKDGNVIYCDDEKVNKQRRKEKVKTVAKTVGIGALYAAELAAGTLLTVGFIRLCWRGLSGK